MSTSQTAGPKQATLEANAGEVHIGEACAACAHPWRAHDAIEARYCTATTTAALARRCICGR